MNDDMSKTIDQIFAILGSIKEPTSSFFLSNFLKRSSCILQDGSVQLEFEVGFPAHGILDNIRLLACNALSSSGFKHVNVKTNWKINAHKVQDGLRPLENVKNIIVIGSGKGGVGKSTISTNLSLALASLGAKVGILDGDIYGPSIPTMLGISNRPKSLDNKSMEPIVAFNNIQTNSIGFLIDPESPTIWRGPMIARALEQLLNQTNWCNLDYMIVDMPPGTGDIALTLAQKVPIVGSIIVTTPQDVSLIDANRCLKMFQKVRIPILGLIENMAIYTCKKCNHTEYIFGKNGGKNLATHNSIPWLGSLPLEKDICEQSDNGQPIVSSNPENWSSKAFLDIAWKVAIHISSLPKDISSKIPPIVVKK